MLSNKYLGKMRKVRTVDEKTLDLQIEIVQVSIYYDLIRRLLIKYRCISMIKVAAISYIIKKREFFLGSIYSAKNTNDLVLKFLSQANGLFDEFCDQLKYIFEAVDILVADGDCKVHEGELTCNPSLHLSVKGFDAFTESVIRESINYTDRQFLKEVISVV